MIGCWILRIPLELRISAQIGMIFEYKYSRNGISIIIEISLFLGSFAGVVSRFDFTREKLICSLNQKNGFLR